MHEVSPSYLPLGNRISLTSAIAWQLIHTGKYSVSRLLSLGKEILGRRHVYPSAASMLTVLQVEGTFPTGTHLVTVERPVSTDDGNMEMALYGSFLPCPSKDAFPPPSKSDYESAEVPGATIPAEGHIVLGPGKKRIRLTVSNKGTRPIQVCFRWLGSIIMASIARARIDVLLS